MRIVSWNVNGWRAAVAHGLLGWLALEQPDVLCAQETRLAAVGEGQAPETPPLYNGYWEFAEKPGYSGVATFSKEPASRVRRGSDSERLDHEGRLLVTEFGSLTLLNVYFPNAKRGLERLEYKLRFYSDFLDLVDAEAAGGRPVIFCGDVNTAHHPIDLARPKQNARSSGFLPEERAHLDRWQEHGWVDAFRWLYPDRAGAYTWWDLRTGARSRNIGWRIDYFFVHRAALPLVKDAGIYSDVKGSDHCPIWLDLEL